VTKGKYPGKLVTLFTDAGYCHNTLAGSWAAWAKCDDNTMRKAGALKGSLRDSTEAEIQAILNGVFCLKKFFQPPAKSFVILQTDSQHAILHLSQRQRSQIFEHYRLKFVEAMQDLRWEFRHVQGHQGTKTPRHAVNTWCDEQCKLHLVEARKNSKVTRLSA